MLGNLKFARLGAIAATAIMITAGSAANATPFSMLGGALNPIDNLTPTTVTIIGAGSDLITDLNIFINLEDSAASLVGPNTLWNDMTMALEHNGTTVVLNQGDVLKDGLFIVTFDDAALTNISAVVDDAVGSLRPDDAVGDLLSAFNGHSLAGNWNLTFTDVTGAFFGETALIHWNISGDAVAPTTAVPEPGTLALFGLGLAGLGFARRRKVA
jgi:hypothetical protein